MTNTQKHLSWSLFGLVLLLVSLFVWNSVWSNVVAVRRPTQRLELQKERHALSASTVEVIPDFRKAAPEYEDEGAGEPESELDQWNLRRVYSLAIPSLNVRAPVYLPPLAHWENKEWDLLEQQMQVGLTYGAVAYPHSATPSGNGVLIVAGHSSPPTERAEQSAFGHLFARLPELQVGDTIRVGYGSETHTYEMVSSKIVPATDTSILVQEDEALLKIITCFPIGTSKDRLVVTARRVE